MTIKEGPAFGAIIIGAGVGYLYLQQYGNLKHALLVAGGLAIADYIVLVWIASFKKKKHDD